MILLYIGAIVFALGMIGSALHRKQLSKHQGWPREEFIAELQKASVSSDIAEAIYDYYKSEGDPPFSVSPDDSLETLFRRSREDVDDDALFLLRTLNVRLPHQRAINQWSKSVNTLRDLAMWVEWARREGGVVKADSA